MLYRHLANFAPRARHYTETIAQLQTAALQLSTRPQTSSAYLLRLYPLSLERSALLAQQAAEEAYAHDGVRLAWEEERDRVEEEWRRGRERVRERLLEGIEERRRRAREEKDGEGISGAHPLSIALAYHSNLTLKHLYVDAALDSQSRPHITRKLRNKLGTSPPPQAAPPGAAANGGAGNGQQPPPLGAPVLPVPNPHSLAVDEIPSPFPLPLTSSSLPSGHSGGGGGGGGGSGGGGKGKKKAPAPPDKYAGTNAGRAIQMLGGGKEAEIENDLGEIRRGAKRRRAAATTHKP